MGYGTTTERIAHGVKIHKQFPALTANQLMGRIVQKFGMGVSTYYTQAIVEGKVPRPKIEVRVRHAPYTKTKASAAKAARPKLVKMAITPVTSAAQIQLAKAAGAQGYVFPDGGTIVF